MKFEEQKVVPRTKKEFLYMEIYLTNMNQIITNMTFIHTFTTSEVVLSPIKSGPEKT